MKQVPSKIESQRLRTSELRGAPFLAGFFLALVCFASPAHAQNNGIVTGRVTNSQGQPQRVLVH